MNTKNSVLHELMIEAGIGDERIEWVERGLRDRNLIVVDVNQAFLVIGWRSPFRRRRQRNVAPS